MTAPRFDPTGALHELRRAVHQAVPMPPAAQIRARVARRVRSRRTAAALAAAAAVAVLALGGAHLAGFTAAPPPPATTPSPSPSPTGEPEPTPSPVPPSPRPAPRTPVVPDDPITRVDWHGTVTLELPEARDGCPSGLLTFRDGMHGGPDGPGVALAVSDHPPYGDVIGDSRLETVVQALCFTSPESLGSGHGWQPLLVTPGDEGTLVGFWVGPRGANIHDIWFDDGRVLMVGDPWTAGPEDHFPAVPGFVLAYAWDGTRFAGGQPAPDYPPIVWPDDTRRPAPVRPRAAVASALRCADDTLRFVEEPSGTLWDASSSTGLYVIQSRTSQQYLFDLDRTGDRLLVTALACVSNGPRKQDPETIVEGVAVFERAGEGWQGISVRMPPRPGLRVAQWGQEGDDVMISWFDPTRPDGDVFNIRYRWTGTELVPVGG